MAKDDPFLPDDPLRRDQLVEVAGVTAAPRRRSRRAASPGRGRRGIRSRKASAALSASAGVQRSSQFSPSSSDLSRSCSAVTSPRLHEQGVQTRRRQRPGGEIPHAGDADVPQDRRRHFQHAFQRLHPLVPVGNSQMLDQKRPVKRIHAAEHEQLFQLRRRMRETGLIDVADHRRRRLSRSPA